MAQIYSAKYLYTGDAPPIVGGALLDVNGKVAAVGTLAELKKAYPGTAVTEYADAVLLPLLINAHTHLELTDFPDWAIQSGETEEPEDFVDWILRLIRVKRSLKKKHYNQSIANGIEQSIASGTGAVGDIMSQHAIRKAYKNSPLRGVLFLETLGRDPGIISRVRQELREILCETKIGKLTLGISPHSPYTISADYLEEIYVKCQKKKLPCTTHLAESSAEVDFIESSAGDLAKKLYPYIGWEYLIPAPASCRPTEYLQQHQGLFAGNLLVHGVQLDTTEIESLANNGMSLVLCPRSNARLKVGKAPIKELRAAGVNLSLGTDSLASNESLSIWDEMAFAHQWFDGAVDAPTLLQMATLQGAQALGLETKMGTLEPGKLSSFQVLRPESVVGESELLDYLVAPGRTAEIQQVYHQGRPQL